MRALLIAILVSCTSTVFSQERDIQGWWMMCEDNNPDNEGDNSLFLIYDDSLCYIAINMDGLGPSLLDEEGSKYTFDGMYLTEEKSDGTFSVIEVVFLSDDLFYMINELAETPDEEKLYFTRLKKDG